MNRTISESELREAHADLLALERIESEALNLYVPSEIQEGFHACRSSVRVALGGNRSGKTTVGAVELARAVLGRDPYGKYPKENGRAMIVGQDHRHIGITIWPKLFKAGAFKMIRDAVSGKWRAYNPNTDKDREDEVKPAPPLIPRRYIKSETWHSKGDHQFNRIELKNGWEIMACSSQGDAPQGFDADIIWIDEDIDSTSDYYSEMMARILDRKGRLYWTAMPHSQCEDLLSLQELAEDEADKPNPIAVKMVMTLLDNPHIDEELKRAAIAMWEKQGEEVVRMRVYGEFNFDKVKWFPKFNERVHGIQWSDLPDNHIPHDWTKYISIDPGYGTAAALFFAVPPQEDRIILFDEIYEHDCNAERFAELMRLKTANYVVQEFVIDDHGSRVSQAGSGRSILDHYQAEIKAAGVKSVRKRWHPGCDDIVGRNECGRQWLEVQEDTGQPYFQYIDGMVPNFVREMKRYRRKKTPQGVVLDKPAGRNNHACDCYGYMAAHEPVYVRPPKMKSRARMMADRILKKRSKNRKNYISCGAA